MINSDIINKKLINTDIYLDIFFYILEGCCHVYTENLAPNLVKGEIRNFRENSDLTSMHDVKIDLLYCCFEIVLVFLICFGQNCCRSVWCAVCVGRNKFLLSAEENVCAVCML